MFFNCINIYLGFEKENNSIDNEVPEEEKKDPLEYNIEHGKGNYQGDIMLTKEEKELLHRNGEDRSLNLNLWPRTGSFVNIPYVIDEKYKA